MLITDMKDNGRGLIESHTRVLHSVAEKNKKIQKDQIVSGVWGQYVDILKRSWNIKLSRTKLYPLKLKNYIEG
jgi:hypothetical protein